MTPAPRPRNWRSRAVAIALALAAATLLAQTGLFQRVEWQLADAAGRLTAPRLDFEDVLVVDIDEESMSRLASQIGPWPYDREIFALVTGFLLEAGARAVAYDVLFAEARRGDDVLALALEPRVVLAAAALPYPLGRDERYRRRLGQNAWQADAGVPAFDWPDITLPRAELAAAASVGVISIMPDADGLLRRVPLLHRTDGKLLPGFPLATMYAGGPAPALSAVGGELQVGERRWPVNSRGEVELQFPRDWSQLQVLPFYKLALAASHVPEFAAIAEQVRGRTVVIGSSSAVFGDLVPTPIGRIPGLYLVAAVPSLLTGGHVYAPRAPTLDALVVLLALLSLFAVAAHPAIRRRVSLQVLTAPLVLVLVGGAATAMFAAGRPVGILLPLAAAALAYLLLLLWRQVDLYRQNRRLAYEKLAAEEAARLKSRFLSYMTHELRTPLTAIMGFNNISWLDDELGREQRMRNGEIVDRNCRYLLTLINNILDQAKIEAGQMAISRSPERLQDVVEDVLTTLRPLAKGKPIELSAQATGLPEALEIDAFRLRQILLNLVGNALKFTERGQVRVAAAWREGILTLEVADTGPGMSAQGLGRIFEAFQQADSGVAAKHGGTGLGLAISRNLLRLMDGDIAVESEPGKGTRFRVSLPAQAAVPAAAETGAAAQEPPRAPILNGTVLIAEDSEVLQLLTTK
jgi:signal transduction histidine kinase